MASLVFIILDPCPRTISRVARGGRTFTAISGVHMSSSFDSMFDRLETTARQRSAISQSRRKLGRCQPAERASCVGGGGKTASGRADTEANFVSLLPLPLPSLSLSLLGSCSVVSSRSPFVPSDPISSSRRQAHCPISLLQPCLLHFLSI